MAGTVQAPVVVVGAGAAGLAAALFLARAGRAVLVAEQADGVGGLARTVERDGYRFDLGGHRFFTRVPEVRALWEEMLGAEMLVRRRRSRILFRGRAFDYPITAGGALAGLGPAESARVLLSYLAARVRPVRPEASLADWLVNRFGRRLFETFFRPYTEKVWGMPCEAIGAQWAAQRIRRLSLQAALADALRRGSGGQRTLATEFRYPRLGPGMLWDRMRAAAEAAGADFRLGHRLVRLRHDGDAVRQVELAGLRGPVVVPAAHVVATIPLRDLVPALEPAPSSGVAAAAAALRYRDFLVVALVLEGPDPFPDTWLYLHDPGVRAGRVQNFRAWSPELVPDPTRSCLGFEYFCSHGDDLWRRSDAELVEIALADLAAIGSGRAEKLVRGHVVRVRDAYPVYGEDFARHLAAIRAGLAGLANLQVAGRNGMHRYNNMDHSILTGLLAARNVLGEANDLWAVNADEGYLEPAPARGRDG
ncbi:MAG TPA: FAD-dependent oxidoreductase [Anaeromyxobacteraceae bacterium]|nr:FAD-dependent oxidoreductase [Anaeromyxobacteraceae bacterium]